MTRVQDWDTLMASRLEGDAWHAFRPHTGQKRFLSAVLHSGCYENWLCCANRYGKSDIGAYCDAYFMRYGMPDPRPAIGPSAVVWDRACNMWVIGPDYQTLTQALIPKLFDNGMVSQGAAHKPFIPQREIRHWDANAQVLRLHNGGIAQFKSNEQRQVKFSAQGIDIAHFDEPPDLLNYQETTLRIEAGQRLRIYATCTILPPEKIGGGISWIYQRIIKPFLAGQSQKIQVFGGSVYENPHLLPEEIARLEAMYPEGSVERRIRLGGEWLPDIAGSRKYRAFDPHIHVDDEVALNPRYPLLWAWDFNVRPFATVLAQYLRGEFAVCDEIYLQEGSIEDQFLEFRRRYPSYPNAIHIYGDATGANRTAQTNLSSYTIILNGLQHHGSPVRLRVPDSNPSVTSRVNAMNMALRGIDGRVGMKIHSRCKELIEDLVMVVDDGKGGIYKSSDPQNPHFWRTHASDALGYLVAYEQPVRLTQPSSDEAPSRRNVKYPHYRHQGRYRARVP